jgi:hypothetical protein
MSPKWEDGVGLLLVSVCWKREYGEVARVRVGEEGEDGG